MPRSTFAAEFSRRDPSKSSRVPSGATERSAVEVTFKVGRRGSATERQGRRVDLARWARVFVGLENQEAYTKAKVIGRDNRGVQVAIDLLEENFVHKSVVQADEAPVAPTTIRKSRRGVCTQCSPARCAGVGFQRKAEQARRAELASFERASLTDNLTSLVVFLIVGSHGCGSSGKSIV